MIYSIINEIKKTVKELQDSIKQDIEDVKKANHEALLNRNTIKLDSMEKIVELKSQLNIELAKEYSNGVDITVYRENIDDLENDLRELYKLNNKLASIVLPVHQMYKEIIDDITAMNGGSLVEVMA